MVQFPIRFNQTITNIQIVADEAGTYVINCPGGCKASKDHAPSVLKMLTNKAHSQIGSRLAIS